jgi:hypothetical protein
MFKFVVFKPFVGVFVVFIGGVVGVDDSQFEKSTFLVGFIMQVLIFVRPLLKSDLVAV